MKKLVNISIDDVSPHPLASTKVLQRCHELIRVFPSIKFTLFIPTAYWKTMRPNLSTENPLQIDLFEDFCNELRDLPEENFELGYHGHYHGIPGKSDNDELQYLEYDQTDSIIDAMFEVAKRANLKHRFKPIIRPPAWRMSPGAIRRFRDRGFKVLALSPDDYCTKVYEGEHLKKDDVVLYNVNPPLKDFDLFEKTEMVFHASEWDRNFLSEEMCESLKQFLIKNKDQIDFCFMQELL